ncbi:hypothetical protein LCGC14_0543530 [marine sediment metagenome]|uniref:Uncharacterized protein n=1 Tax=marine sediment metagenome TaxID=412755 RepID=A0A0F9RWN4_9ZZZZ
MIISASIIKRPCKVRQCENCHSPIDGKQLRLYGAAETSDPPYVIYIHPHKCLHVNPLDNSDIKEALSRSGYTYWIDKQGGSHYHKEDCVMVKEPRYHYEPITRTMPRIRNLDGYGMTRIREGGKYYNPCACMFERRQK